MASSGPPPQLPDPEAGQRVLWDTHTHVDTYGISAVATTRKGLWRASASAELCLSDPTEWGVPLGVPRRKVLRFSRVVSTPKGKGGGSAVIEAVLRLADKLGYWTVLEANPYPGQNLRVLRKFYKRHGFLRHPQVPDLMFRGPGGVIG